MAIQVTRKSEACDGRRLPLWFLDFTGLCCYGFVEIKMTRFNGPEYKTASDHSRLSNQHARIRSVMSDGAWRTLQEIADITGDPVSSISAQLRHLRKERFGSHIINRRPRNNRDGGLFEYQLLLQELQNDLFEQKTEKKIRPKLVWWGDFGFSFSDKMFWIMRRGGEGMGYTPEQFDKWFKENM